MVLLAQSPTCRPRRPLPPPRRSRAGLPDLPCQYESGSKKVRFYTGRKSSIRTILTHGPTRWQRKNRVFRHPNEPRWIWRSLRLGTGAWHRFKLSACSHARQQTNHHGRPQAPRSIPSPLAEFQQSGEKYQKSKGAAEKRGQTHALRAAVPTADR